MTEHGMETTSGGKHVHEPSMETLLKLRKELDAELKRNPSSTSDTARKMEALVGQIARRKA
jgi:hypothetical protein